MALARNKIDIAVMHRLGLAHVSNALKMPDEMEFELFERRYQPITGHKKRQLDFETGRFCAALGLERLGLETEVRSAKDRSPIWPDGAVGSISHSEHFAWSAVGFSSDFASIGIDTEPIAAEETFEHLCDEILSPGELEFGIELRLNELQIFTLIFSAKESYYKCVYPLNPVFFGFHEVEITSVVPGKISMQLNNRSPNQFCSPCPIDIKYLISGENVFTACWLRSGCI